MEDKLAWYRPVAEEGRVVILRDGSDPGIQSHKFSVSPTDVVIMFDLKWYFFLDELYKQVHRLECNFLAMDGSVIEPPVLRLLDRDLMDDPKSRPRHIIKQLMDDCAQKNFPSVKAPVEALTGVLCGRVPYFGRNWILGLRILTERGYQISNVLYMLVREFAWGSMTQITTEKSRKRFHRALLGKYEEDMKEPMKKDGEEGTKNYIFDDGQKRYHLTRVHRVRVSGKCHRCGHRWNVKGHRHVLYDKDYKEWPSPCPTWFCMKCVKEGLVVSGKTVQAIEDAASQVMFAAVSRIIIGYLPGLVCIEG